MFFTIQPAKMPLEQSGLDGQKTLARLLRLCGHTAIACVWPLIDHKYDC